MSNLFKSPSSTPQWTSPTGVDESRQNLLNSLSGRALTQGPSDIQNTGAQMLSGLMGSNFGTGYQTGQRTLEEAATTGLPWSLQNLQSLEQQRMQQLPYEMAGVTEQLTARGMGADTDLARILGETAGRAQTDIAATMAPYYLQAGEAQAGRQVNAAQQLLPYAQLPVNAALGAIGQGNAMRPAIDPVIAQLSNLAGSGALAQTQYGPSLGSQLLQAGAAYLPWAGLSKMMPALSTLYNQGGQAANQVGDWWNSLMRDSGIGGNGVSATPENLDWLFNQPDLNYADPVSWYDAGGWANDVPTYDDWSWLSDVGW